MVRPLSFPPRPASLTRVGVTRAHLGLGHRPQLRAELGAWIEGLAKQLGGRLESEVVLEARVLDGAVRSPAGLTCPAAFGLLSLDAVGGFAVLEVETPLVASLVDRMAGGPGEPLAPMPITEAEEAGLSLLLLDVLSSLRTTPLEQALAPRLVRVLRSAAEVSAATDLRLPHLAVQVKVRCGTAAGLARLLIPASALRCWLAGSKPEVVPTRPELVAAELELGLRLGRAHLTRADLASLRAGDVVLLDDLRRQDGALVGGARLLGTAFALVGTVAGPHFSLTRLHIPQEPPMNAKTQPLTAPELPVDVEVELCRIRLTLGELAGLQPGSVLPLRITAGEPVLLKLGETALAVVELVDVEGEIGARILRLSKRGSP
jgi:type III secretion protein Q